MTDWTAPHLAAGAAELTSRLVLAHASAPIDARPSQLPGWTRSHPFAFSGRSEDDRSHVGEVGSHPRGGRTCCPWRSGRRGGGGYHNLGRLQNNGNADRQPRRAISTDQPLLGRYPEALRERTVAATDSSRRPHRREVDTGVDERRRRSSTRPSRALLRANGQVLGNAEDSRPPVRLSVRRLGILWHVRSDASDRPLRSFKRCLPYVCLESSLRGDTR
jgi:hypothetical protein